MSYLITDDDYYQKNQPAKSEEIANIIEVYTQPLSSSEIQELYKSTDAIRIIPYSTKMVEIVFDKKPVTEAEISLESTTAIVIAESTIYAWGATVILENPSGTLDSAIISANGRLLVVSGEELITRRDELSIREYGEQKYTLPKNHLIQTREQAERIAEELLQSYKTVHKDIEIDWRGNPALELTDEIEVHVYKSKAFENRGTFYITKNTFEFDGTLKQQTNGRKTQ
ncbi:MAG: hypothetical protein JW915_24200 [Chitinispirillaceae bacterium]|nr:hypothetical protein [Chitinispirillaceae bacterium]